MLIYFIIGLVTLIPVFISFISTKGVFTDMRYKKQWWKIITKRGWWVIGLTLLIDGLLLYQNYLTEKKDDLKDAAISKQAHDRDSAITAGVKAGVDSSRKKLFGDLSEAFSKQGLRLDTVNKSIGKLQDSLKNRPTIEVHQDKKPMFDICPYGVKLVETDGKTQLSTNFCSFEDWLQVQDAKLYIILIEKSGTESLLTSYSLSNVELSPTGGSAEYRYNLPDTSKIFGVGLYVGGTYTDKTLKPKYDVNINYVYDFKKNLLYLRDKKIMIDKLKALKIL